MLEDGQAESQADLARLFGVSCARITQTMNLLKLAPEIQDFVVNLDDTDKRLQVLTERRLRSLAQCNDSNGQVDRFAELINDMAQSSQSACT